ncbi:MAG: trypsin-like peptidase domain-containing protein [Planctomycetota bacterium]|nr:trypsin-like peptidase domain-containing protein [Planctomycetota bacterium]
MRRFVALGPALLVLFTSALMLLLVPGLVRRADWAATHAALTVSQETLDNDDLLKRFDTLTRAVATSVEPSVVHIDVAQTSGDVLFRRGSSGSGWVYDDAGHIVTNAHVVRGARQVSVQFHDGRVEIAEIVGADPLTDIAVLNVPVSGGLFPARRAVGDRVEQGDRVYAFGSPFGFKFSMSEGIVSGLGRTAGPNLGFTGFTNFIQTDAAVNPGNSGGPLVDRRGRVIGMNVAIATARDSSEEGEGQSAGISFAIPLQTIETVVEQLIGGGKVARGYLGISFDTRVVAIEHEGSFKGNGLKIERFAEDSPSEAAGLKVGDVIVALDGQRVQEMDVLRSIITSYRPGQKVKVRAWRQSEFVEVEVVLGRMPVAATVDERFRLRLAHSTGLLFSNDPSGVVVTQVIPDSPADKAGFKVGQIITQVAGEGVSDIRDALGQMIDAGVLEGRAVEIQVLPPGEEGHAPPETLRLKIKP